MAGALLAILAIADALLMPSPETRQTGAWAMLVVVLVTAFWRTVREQWRRRDPAEELRQLEQRAGLPDELLSTGVQFALSPPAGSAWMAQRTVALAAVRAASLTSRELPCGAWRRSALVAGVTVAVVTVACIPSDGRALVWRALAPFGDTSRPSRVVVTVTSGDQVVTAGATVVLAARTEPMASSAVAELRWDDGTTERQSLVAEASGEWRGAVGPVQGSFRWRVLAGDGEGPARRVQVVPRARLESLRLRITPPAYAKQPDRLVSGGDTSVVAGSRILVEGDVTGDPPVAGVLVTGSQELALGIVDRRLSVTWSPTRSTAYALRLVGAGGVVTELPQRWFVAVEVDRPPQVALLAPLVQSVVADLGLPVALTVQVGEDLGLASLGLRLGGPSGRLRDLPLPATGQGTVVVSILPEAEGLQPGDLLEAQAEAVDLGGQRGVSQVLTLNVVDAAAGRSAERVAVMNAVAADVAGAESALADCLKHWAEAVRLARPDDATAWRSEAKLIGERLAVVRARLMAAGPAWRSAAAGLPPETMLAWHQWVDVVMAWNEEVGVILAAPLAELARSAVDLDELHDALRVAQAMVPEVAELAKAAGQAAQAAVAVSDATRGAVLARRLEDGRRAVALAEHWAGARAATVVSRAAWHQARLGPPPAALSATAAERLADQLATFAGVGTAASGDSDAIIPWATAVVATVEQRAALMLKQQSAPEPRRDLCVRLRAWLLLPKHPARPWANALRRAAAAKAEASWRLALAPGADGTVRLLAAEVLRQAAAPPEALARLAGGATAAERGAVAAWASALGQVSTELDEAHREAGLRQVGQHLVTAELAAEDGRVLAASRQQAMAVALIATLEPSAQVQASAHLYGDLAWFQPARRAARGPDEAMARLAVEMPAVPGDDPHATVRARRAVLIALAELSMGAGGRVEAMEAVLTALAQGGPTDAPVRALLTSKPGPPESVARTTAFLTTPPAQRQAQAQRVRALLSAATAVPAPGLPLAALQQAVLEHPAAAPGVMALVEALPANGTSLPAGILAKTVAALQPDEGDVSATAMAATALRLQLLCESARRNIARAAADRELVAAVASGVHMLPEASPPESVVATLAQLETDLEETQTAATNSTERGAAWWRAAVLGEGEAQVQAAAAWLATRAHCADTLADLHATQTRLWSECAGVADPFARAWPLVRAEQLSATVAGVMAQGIIAGLVPPAAGDDEASGPRLRRLALWLADELERPATVDALPTPRLLRLLTMGAEGGAAAVDEGHRPDELIARVAAGATTADQAAVPVQPEAQQAVITPAATPSDPSRVPASGTGWAGMDLGAWTRGAQGDQRRASLRYLEDFPAEQQEAIRAYRRRLEGR